MHAGLCDNVRDDGHVTSKPVSAGYCDVIDDNMAPDCCHQLYHHHHHHHHHPYHHLQQQHWTLAPPPPSYSSTNWDAAAARPLQPSAPQLDPAHMTSRAHYVTDSAAISNQDASSESLPPATCPQCRQQRPVCV